MALLLLPAMAQGAEIAPAAADAQTEIIEPSVTERFLAGKKEGYFFYVDPKEVEKKKPKLVPAPPPPVAEVPKPAEKLKADPVQVPFSIAWLRKWLPIVTDRAIENPTQKNLESFAYLKRAMFDMLQNHASKLHDLVVSDPLLDENNRMPMAEYAKSAYMLDEINARDMAIKEIAKTAGFFVFYDSKCDWCLKQVPVLNSFGAQTGMTIKYISVDGQPIAGAPTWVPDNGHAQMLDLKVYPTTVLAVPPAQYYVLSQGMMDKQTLGERVVMAAEKAGLLSEAMLTRLFPARRGVLRPEDLADRTFSDDPDVWIPKLKEKLRGRY